MGKMEHKAKSGGLIAVDERKAAGRALRDRFSRSTQGRWEPPSDRPDPLAVVRESNAHRLSRTDSDPLWADGENALHLLPGPQP